MRLHKRLLALLLSLVLCFTIFSLPIAAATVKVVEWDGKSKMVVGKNYTVSKTVKVSGSYTIPKGVTLTIKKSGVLKLNSSATLNVNGTLTLNSGSNINVSGTLNENASGKINISGTLTGAAGGKINIRSTVTISSSGVFKCSSKMNVYRTGSIKNSGTTYLYKSSNTTLSGKIYSYYGAVVSLTGKVSVSLSGAVSNNGKFTINSGGRVLNSGTFTLQSKATYKNNGKLTNTKSGVLKDNRPKYTIGSQTAAILENEQATSIFGIDISKNNGTIDWAQVKASGVNFVMLRAVVGNNPAIPNDFIGVDSKFHENIKGALAAGLNVGVYNYSHATTPAEAKAEAQYLISVLKNYKITYPVVFDFEEDYQLALDKDTITAIIKAFMNEITDAGYYPMLYSFKSCLENILDMDALSDYAVWLAEWRTTATYSGKYYMWQHDAVNNIKGINGYVDVNISYRDFAAIIKKYNLNNLT